ncbi:MAG: alpha/beta fold hydrolase [Solirubrobacterales bacterium]|nr:alpha/beta fold hydrolase [Solirubrobacterales bacterium]
MGLHIVVRVQLSYDRFGRGEPLVLIPGIGSRRQVWAPVLDRLTAQREVVALDLPGFGDAPVQPAAGTPAGVGPLTGLVSGFLDELGLERPHLAGNSLGGWISLELAKRGRARSVTALSPAGFSNRRETTYARLSLQLSVRTGRLLVPRADRLFASPLARMLIFGQLVAHPTRISSADAAASLRALALAPWFDETLRAAALDRFRDGEQISVPVTIAWGEKDRLLLPRQARHAARLIPGARIVILRGCGHVPMYDDPGQVAQVLLDRSRD